MPKSYPCRFNNNLSRYDFDKDLDNYKILPLNANCFSHYLEVSKDKKKFNKCIILGNGPSLKNVDFSLLKNCTIFGSNRCYLGFNEWGRPVDYWFCTDRMQIELYHKEYLENIPNDVIKFFPVDYSTFINGENVIFFNQSYKIQNGFKFSNDPSIFYPGYTVTYSILQAAVMMGYKKIFMLGMDHNYPVKRGFNKFLESGTISSRIFLKLIRRLPPIIQQRLNPQTWTSKSSTSDTHFSSNYTKGNQFVIPRVELMDKAFNFSRKWCDTHGIEVYNCTPDSKLDSFIKSDFPF